MSRIISVEAYNYLNSTNAHGALTTAELFKGCEHEQSPSPTLKKLSARRKKKKKLVGGTERRQHTGLASQGERRPSSTECPEWQKCILSQFLDLPAFWIPLPEMFVIALWPWQNHWPTGISWTNANCLGQYLPTAQHGLCPVDRWKSFWAPLCPIRVSSAGSPPAAHGVGWGLCGDSLKAQLLPLPNPASFSSTRGSNLYLRVCFLGNPNFDRQIYHRLGPLFKHLISF